MAFGQIKLKTSTPKTIKRKTKTEKALERAVAPAPIYIPEELVEIKEEMIGELLLKPEGIKPVVEEIQQLVRSFEFNTRTEQGRKDITSLAYKVSKSKTFIENIGKKVVDPWVQKKKSIDKERNYVKKTLDALRDEVKKPLIEWEERTNPKEEVLDQRLIQEGKDAIHLKIEKAIVKELRITGTKAASLVTFISQGKIPNVEIKY